MLTATKQKKLLESLKDYHKRYIKTAPAELDESGTRLMVNHLLIEVLGFAPIEEVKTEYMIRGTYADYVIQLKNKKHFLVEVKAMGFDLSDKHLRQAVNYGANEGIEWAVLTNGRQLELYRIIFGKPLSSKKVFVVDLSNPSEYKEGAEVLQYLHKTSIENKGLDSLWERCTALDPINIASFLLDKTVVNFLKRSLKTRYNGKFSDEDVIEAVKKLLCDPVNMELVKPQKVKSKKKAVSKTIKAMPDNKPISESALVKDEQTVKTNITLN